MAMKETRTKYEQEDKRGWVNKETLEASEHQNLLHEFQRRRRADGAIQSSSRLMILTFGQFIALVATLMNATSYALEYDMHRVFPMFLLCNSYAVLTLHIFLRNTKNNEHPPLSQSNYECKETDTHCHRTPFTDFKLQTPWYYYFCLSCLDIGPNYLSLLAMNKTSFTSATLLGSLTIPATMIFCRILLSKEYRLMHYIGVILCMIGGSVTIFTDKVANQSSGVETTHPHSYAGDVLAIFASLGYGFGDACAEFWSKHVSREEYLGMIGLFGTIFTFTASIVSERNAVLELFTGDNEKILQTIGFIVSYTATLVTYYVLESLFLMKSDATLLNLSLLTSNFWAVLFSKIAFQEAPDLNFYISILMVIFGAFVYEHYGN
mmetsp:Transcript_18277/g.42069  ORF Transcript_18277/g.42069 Transcript_18277/m.42069 type:complete len:378 (+) Transcript_18277:169-1302(+)